MPDTTGYYVEDFLILSGQWRPQCPWEHIAWISPPWPSRYYLWLDFPEAVFDRKDGGTRNHYLSHINNKFPPLSPNLSPIPWQAEVDGLTVERKLPNDVAFTAQLARRDSSVISMELKFYNGGTDTLRNVRIQTCAYLRGIAEFSEFTLENKFLYSGDDQWVNMTGWKGQVDFKESGLLLPVVATLSNEADRLAAMTWYGDTIRLAANPRHPCMHADPGIPDLPPGESAEVQGELIFYEGNLESFTDWFRDRLEIR